MAWPSGAVAAARAPPQLLEVQHDRLVRAQQIGEDLLARPRLRAAPRPIARGTATAARGCRAAARPRDTRARCRAAPGRRCAARDRRSAAASVGSTSDSSVKTCARLWLARSLRNSSTNDRCSSSSSAIEQAMAFPDRPADRDFAPDDVEDALAVDADRGVLLEDRRQRAAALEAHLEAQCRRGRAAAPSDGALRDADREHARQPPPDGERLVRIDQRVDQLADVLLGDLAQRADRVFGHRIPGQQRDDVRHQRRRQPFLVAQHAAGRGRDRASAAPGSPASRGRRQRGGAGGQRRRLRCTVRPRAPVSVGVLQRAQHRRARRQVFDVGEVELDGPVEQAALERLDVARFSRPADDQRQPPSSAIGGRAGSRRTGCAAGSRMSSADQAAADRVAEPIEADVDDRLRGPLLG